MIGFDQVYPLWLLASKDSGGLQWTTSKIGKVMANSAGECYALRVFESVSAPFRLGRAECKPLTNFMSCEVGSSVGRPILVLLTFHPQD